MNPLRSIAASIAIALALGAGVPAFAQEKPGVVMTDVIEAVADVTAVDQAARTVTLKGSRGNAVTLAVPDEAQNFDQVKVGDKVLVRYMEETALFVSGAGGAAGASQRDIVALALKGGTPGGAVASVVEVSATVEALSYEERWADLRGPDGKLRRVNVPASVKRFGEVKVGGLVVVRHTEAVALTLQKQ
jgi:hypothetical protein